MTYSLHASAVIVGEDGLLIRGAAGAGKSQLSLALVAHAKALGLFSALVADDRVRVFVVSGRVIAGATPGFAGLIERRGEGIVSVPFESRAVLRLLVDLSPVKVPTPRMLAEEDRMEDFNGVRLPRLRLGLATGLDQSVWAVMESLCRRTDGSWRKNTPPIIYFA